MESDLNTLDWRMQWYLPFAKTGQPAARDNGHGKACFDVLNQLDQAPIRFVHQSDLPAGEPYERYIFQTGNCPTRDNLHDFFNGLCWIHFPQTKRRLNQLQAAQIELDGIGQVRGAVRDALTVFDENAAFLQAPDALWDALVAKDWAALFVDMRPLWRDAQLVLFGHALLEKLVSPRKGITAHVYRVHAPSHRLADLDAWVAADLNVEKLSAKPFAHLPVLGVPGWWPQNEDPQFYADARVFRARAAGSQPPPIP